MKRDARLWLLAIASWAAVAAGAVQPAHAQGTVVLSVSNTLARPADGLVAPVTLMLLRESFAEVLRKNGRSIAAWREACRGGQQACKADLGVVAPVFVAAASSRRP